MTDPDTEIAREIAYQCSEGLGLGGTGWGKHIQFVLDKIRSVRQEENEACAKVAETPTLRNIGAWRSKKEMVRAREIATAIRNRYKDEK